MNWYGRLCQTVVDMLENTSTSIANDEAKDITEGTRMGPFSHQDDPSPDNWDGDMRGDPGLGFDPEHYDQRANPYERVGIEKTPKGMWERSANSFVAISDMTDIHIVNTMALVARLHATRIKAAGSNGSVPFALIARPYGNWSDKYMELSRELKNRARARKVRDTAEEHRIRLRRQHGEQNVVEFDHLIRAFKMSGSPAFQEFQAYLRTNGYTIQSPKSAVNQPNQEGRLRISSDD